MVLNASHHLLPEQLAGDALLLAALVAGASPRPWLAGGPAALRPGAGGCHPGSCPPGCPAGHRGPGDLPAHHTVLLASPAKSIRAPPCSASSIYVLSTTTEFYWSRSRILKINALLQGCLPKARSTRAFPGRMPRRFGQVYWYTLGPRSRWPGHRRLGPDDFAAFRTSR